MLGPRALRPSGNHSGHAKQLISQYESMGTFVYAPNSDPDAGAVPYDISSSIVVVNMSREKSTRKKQYLPEYRSHPGHEGGHRADIRDHRHGGRMAKKAPSPIRQSLRNLIAVITKGALGKKRDSSESYCGDGNANGTLHRRKKKAESDDGTLKAKPKGKEPNPAAALVLRPNVSIGVVPTLDSQSAHLPQLSTKKTIGTLFFPTSSDSMSSHTCAWKSYTATLDPIARTLQLWSSQSNNSTKISLAGCIDIRSLDASKLSKAEIDGLEKAAAPPHEADKLRAFEIRFKDESKEKFVAVGVRERARWISAIWDAILPENKKAPSSLYASTLRSRSTSRSPTPPPTTTDIQPYRLKKHQLLTKPIESPVPHRLSSLLNNPSEPDARSHTPSSVNQDRALPPLPPGSLTSNPYDHAPWFKESNSPSIPTAPSKKNYLNLHLEIPPVEENTLSQVSMYPNTSCGGDSGESSTPEPTLAPQPPLLGNSSPSSTTVVRPFSRSSYFSSSRGELESRTGFSAAVSPYHPPPSTSVLLGTAIKKANYTITASHSLCQSTSPIQSPSISNLSQLSVVRQRLAQIERSHSQVSAKSVASSFVSTLGANAGSAITTDSGGLAALGSLVDPSSVGRATRPDRPGTSLRADQSRAKSPSSSLLFSRLSKSSDGQSPSDTEMELVSTPKPTKKERTLPTSLAYGGRTLSSPPLVRALEPTRRYVHPPSTESRNPNSSVTIKATPKDLLKVNKEGIEDVSKRVDAIKSVLGGEPGEPTIHEVVRGLEDKTRNNGEVLSVIRKRVRDIDLRLGDLASTLAVAADAPSNEEKPGEKVMSANISAAFTEVARLSQQEVLQAIEDVRAKLKTDFPILVDDVREVRSLQDKLVAQVTNLTEGNARKSIVNVTPTPESPSHRDGDVDLKPVLDRLDGLKFLLAASQAGEKKTEQLAEGASKGSVLEHLENILTHVQEESTKQVIFAQQQADSVRYLNELNNWLETFVTNGTSQIQGLSSNIQHLSNALGCTFDSPSQQPPGALGAVPQVLTPGRLVGGVPSLLGDIRHLVLGMQARDQNFAALQSAVHSLLEALSTSQAQMGAESQAISGLITRQRQEQEALLRTFTSEISGEIKGERLRFVEAMKEATAINVQLHVEHFKQDLSREVMAMTEEVGRLHREKQIIENQISDLFAFYSKHKEQETTNVQPAKREQERPQRAPIPRSSQYRPLPQPRRH